MFLYLKKENVSFLFSNKYIIFRSFIEYKEVIRPRIIIPDKLYLNILYLLNYLLLIYLLSLLKRLVSTHIILFSSCVDTINIFP